MMVSLPNVLTTIAVVWLVVLLIVCSCESKSDKEDVACGLALLMTVLSGGILLYRGIGLLFALVGG